MARKATPMTKPELLSAIAKELSVTKKEAGKFIQVFHDIACNEINKNNCFVIPGLTKIYKVYRKARTGRNPSTGEEIKIKARTALRFKPAKALRDATISPKTAKSRSPTIKEVKFLQPEIEALNLENSVVWMEGWFESKEDLPWKVLKTYQDPLEKIVVVYKKKNNHAGEKAWQPQPVVSIQKKQQNLLLKNLKVKNS